MAAQPSTAAEATEMAEKPELSSLPNLAPTGMIGDLQGPSGIAVTEGGEIVVAETGRCRVSIINRGSYGERKSFGHAYGEGPGQFDRPEGVAIDSGGNILVTDSFSNCIQQFSSSGDHIKTVGTRGSGPLQFDRPGGIKTHPTTGKVYVADTGNHKIQVLNSDLTYSTSFGTKGSNNGEFNYPFDVCIDSDGNVYVADSENHRIQVFTADGVYLRQFESKDQTDKPVSIAVDSQNVVYVCEYRDKCKVSLFSTDGDIIKSFGSFHGAFGITVDEKRTVYISESDFDRVHVFNYFP